MSKYKSCTFLHAYCIEKFGAEYLNWEPETLQEELPELSDIDIDKINAVSVILTTPSFYTYFEVFESLGNLLNHNKPSFESITPLTPDECLWAVVESRILDDDDPPFSLEVIKYIETSFKYHGIAYVHPELKKIGVSLNYDTPDEKEKALPQIMLLTRWKRIVEEFKEHFGKAPNYVPDFLSTDR